MNKIFLTTLLFITALHVWGQQSRYIKLPNLALSVYRISPETDTTNLTAVAKVMHALDLNLVNQNNWHRHYRGSHGSLGRYDVIFSFVDTLHTFPITLEANDEFFDFDSYDRIAYYGFMTLLRENKKVNKNFSQFLVSAYRQEMDTSYLLTEANFTTIPKLDKSKYWKRNMLNMGYGMSYIAKDNPFMGQKGLAIGFGYTMEALHYIPIFGGPFFGKTQADKVGIPLIGLASLAIWKIVYFGLVQGNSYIKHNQIVHNSGYKFPKELKQYR